MWNRSSRVLMVAGGLLALTIGACAPSVGAPSGSPSAAPGQPGASAGETAAVEAVRRDAALRVGGSVEIERVEAREWPDTGLGCPPPDQINAQVVTPGYLVIAMVAGRRLEYHADQRGRVVLCQES